MRKPDSFHGINHSGGNLLMQNLFESAERLYKRISGGSNKATDQNNSKYSRKVDGRCTDGGYLPSRSSCESSLQWVAQKNYSARALSSSNLALGAELEEWTEPSLASPRAPLPPGDLTAVSSGSESDISASSDGGEISGVDSAQIASRNHRVRQSLQRANAAAFDSQLSMPGENQNRYPSAERIFMQVNGSSDEEDDEEEEEENDGVSRKELTEERNETERDPMYDLSGAYKISLNIQSRTGIKWPSASPQPLVDILPKLRKCLIPQSTEFVRAICQRQSCRCLLRGHDTLMLFPVFDAVLCEATWEKIKDLPQSMRSGSHFLSRLQHSSVSNPVSETQTKIIMFRQCRGWYEVMNENFEPVPHWTSVEEVRRAKPAAFLVRRDLKCLLAPQSLWVSPQIPSATDPDAPPIPIPSAIIAEVANSKTIAMSTVLVLRPGTLLSYVDYIHECPVNRGKKQKLISIILAIEKNRPPQRQGEIPSSPQRLFYIATEEPSGQSVFPSKLALSPIAGPENISGVHMLSSLLRKFHLPLSIVPVAVPERQVTIDGNSLANSSESSPYSSYATAQSKKPVNIFPTVPGITFTDRTYIRLRGLLRGDILIVAPIDTPDRFFLITPTLLQDHLFQVGFTEDPMYQRLGLGHRNRTINFLTMAHPRNSLDYLLGYLKNITNKPRLISRVGNEHKLESDILNRLAGGLIKNYEITSTMAKAVYAETGKDPRTGPGSDMTPDQIDQIYDDLEDLYFFTRNGYYPAKARQRRMKSTVDPQLTAIQTSGNPRSSGGGILTVQPSIQRSPIPSAEQLLAASLNLSTYK